MDGFSIYNRQLSDPLVSIPCGLSLAFESSIKNISSIYSGLSAQKLSGCHPAVIQEIYIKSEADEVKIYGSSDLSNHAIIYTYPSDFVTESKCAVTQRQTHTASEFSFIFSDKKSLILEEKTFSLDPQEITSRFWELNVDEFRVGSNPDNIQIRFLDKDDIHISGKAAKI